MLNELFPDAVNVGLLYCSAEPNSIYQADTIRGYLEELGYTCEDYTFADSNDLASVVTNAVFLRRDLCSHGQYGGGQYGGHQQCMPPCGSSDHCRRAGHLPGLRRGDSLHQLL